MLQILGSGHRYCDGMSRRNFLQIGALGTTLTLADVLRLRASGGEGTGRDKSIILIYLGGGPSHMDMWDLKPDAPAEFRGEFKPIPTNVSGIRISEHFPMQAKMFDKLAVIRSLVTVNEHSDSMVMTGYSSRVNQQAKHPSFGSVVSKLRSDEPSPVPPFVSLRGSSRGTEPGYLGVAHRPFTPSGSGNKNLMLARGVDADRLADRQSLLTGFDTARREIDATGTMEGMDAFHTQAVEMITSGNVRKALDLTLEDASVRQRYKGVEDFLRARRLVEAGVGVVTLGVGGWDTHSNNFKSLARKLPILDQGIANLIDDLHQRGLDRDVVTVVWGEFGRTPKVNSRAGRDHWPSVMSALVAGGGLKMGQVIGESTARGERPKDRPLGVQNVLATLYTVLGIDPAMTLDNNSGRPMHLLDEREPVRELLG